jgi:methylated-DNA-[protein]-cysteine S-methyltransferase
MSNVTSSRSTADPQQAACYWDLMPSPLGTLVIVVDGQVRLVELRLDGTPAQGQRSGEHCAAIQVQLQEYFAGARRVFELPLNPQGTEFQHRVWRALGEIGFGEVCDYAHIARRIGQPKATRAVGQANGRNPIPIVIPCHRVIASDGTLGGYSGGLPIKRQLLALEGRRLAS